jgi:hypothetical protein
MAISPECEETRRSAPEVALGIAAGQERASALAHIASCADCRTFLSELGDVADEVLLLVPAHEPGAGFEARVTDRMIAGESAPLRGWRRFLPVAVAALLAGAAAIAGVLVATSDDRRVASHYRDALELADGSYFGVTTLRRTSGLPAGHVFGYEGSPSWIFVVAETGEARATYAVEVVTGAGERFRLGSLSVASGTGTWGGALPVDLGDVERVRLSREHGEAVLEARYRARDAS